MVVSNIFYVHPYLGKIPILTFIFFKWGLPLIRETQGCSQINKNLLCNELVFTKPQNLVVDFLACFQRFSFQHQPFFSTKSDHFSPFFGKIQILLNQHQPFFLVNFRPQSQRLQTHPQPRRNSLPNEVIVMWLGPCFRMEPLQSSMRMETGQLFFGFTLPIYPP